MSSNNSVKKIYAFSFFWMFLVVIPVFVPYCQSLGLSMEEFFQLQAIFGIAVMLLEVPTGYICDLWGRRNSLLVGALISGMGFTYLIYARSFFELALYEVVIAVAMSFVSGADISLLYDANAKSSASNTTKSLANMQLASVSGEAIASILGGLLATISFAHTLTANAVTAWIPFLIALTMIEPVSERLSSKSHLSNFKEIGKKVFSSDDPQLRMIFINLVVWGLSTFFAVWIFQRDWNERGIDLAYFGFIWAGYNILTGIVGRLARNLELKWGTPIMVWLTFLTPISGYFVMGLVAGPWGAAAGVLFYFSRGINGVLLKDLMNRRVPGKMRASVNSLQSFFFRMIFAIGGPAVGFSIDRWGVNIALIGLGIVFSLMLILVGLPLIRMVRRNEFANI
jgi:MFS family permease